MPDWAAAALLAPQLPAAIGIAVVAGLVYGFAGFGAALIAMPVLANLYTPAEAVGIFGLSALGSLLTVVPRAWREGDRTALLPLFLGAAATLPLGVWVLRVAPVEALRWAISLLVLGTTVALLAGWRRAGQDGTGARLAVGAGTGFVGGATGLTGPVMVLFQLSGREGAGRIRANIAIFLSLLSVATLPLLVVNGILGWEEAVSGMILLPAYTAATWAGQALFRPERERVYRYVAYSIVGAAGVMGLPVWR